MTPSTRKRIGRDATLHPATVQKVARGNVVPFHQTPTRTPAPVHPVTSRTVHPQVWQTAMNIARGDVTRIQVLDYTEVRVVNRPRG